MKSVVFGTAGLVFALCGSLRAGVSSSSVPNSGSNANPLPVPTITFSQSGLQSNNTEDSFLVVDKGGSNLADDPASDPGEQDANRKSEESSGHPADSSGVPMPRAGWISFLGVLGVIALRQYGLARRRARTAMN
jgi:hypothetical protein